MSIEQDDEFKEWVLPNFDDNSETVTEERDLFGKPANWYSEKKQLVTEPQEESPQPLTLEDIEAIRASAYEDGFNEGKEAGLAKGLEEGKLQGMAEGHAEGLKQGMQQGLEDGQVKIEAQTLHWQQLVSRLNRPLEKLDDSVEFQLVKLATALAEQITRCEVTVNQQVILQALKQAIDVLPAQEQTPIISLHPEDLSFVQQAFSEQECAKRGWDLRVEPSLARGDCQVQTNTSSIDYTFSSRVEQVLKHFLKENFEHLPEVSDDGDISNDQEFDYQMLTEQQLKEAKQQPEESEVSPEPEVTENSESETASEEQDE